MPSHTLWQMTKETSLQWNHSGESPGRSSEVDILLAAVPEFRGRYLELVEAADDDPGATDAFSELADFVAELAKGLEELRPVLTRCLNAVEKVACGSDEAEEL